MIQDGINENPRDKMFRRITISKAYHTLLSETFLKIG